MFELALKYRLQVDLKLQANVRFLGAKRLRHNLAKNLGVKG
jgi:hypothetical protein